MSTSLRSPAARSSRPQRLRKMTHHSTGTSDVRQVDQRVLVEEDRADERDVAEHRELDRRERRRQRLHVGDAEQRRQPEAEEQHDEAGGQLVGAAAEHEVGVHERQQAAGDGAGEHAEPRVPGLGRRRRRRRARRTSIEPSVPRLTTPARSETVSPRAAYRIDVPPRTPPVRTSLQQAHAARLLLRAEAEDHQQDERHQDVDARGRQLAVELQAVAADGDRRQQQRRRARRTPGRWRASQVARKPM